MMTQTARWMPGGPSFNPPFGPPDGPGTPGRPARPETPGGSPFGSSPELSGLPSWLEERMFGERIVLLRGPVTGEAASRASAALLTLDALGNDAVQLHISAPDGDLSAAFALVDTLDVMRVPVHAMATGEVGGAAIGVYAAARKRIAFPHARFHLAEPHITAGIGTATEVASAAGRYLQALEDLVVRVAAVTGQPRSRVEDDFSAGRFLTAAQAKEYGLVQEIVSTPPKRGGQED